MQVWTQQAHECLMNQLQYRNQVRVQDILQMEHFFPFGIAPPPPLCATQKQERPPTPRPKKEKERESRNLYGIMEK